MQPTSVFDFFDDIALNRLTGGPAAGGAAFFASNHPSPRQRTAKTDSQGRTGLHHASILDFQHFVKMPRSASACAGKDVHNHPIRRHRTVRANFLGLRSAFISCGQQDSARREQNRNKMFHHQLQCLDEKVAAAVRLRISRAQT